MLVRSKWKYNKLSLNENIGREVCIFKNHVGLFFNVLNGKERIEVEVKPEMVGYKFGDFIVTKKIGSKCHKLHKKSSSYRRKKKR